MERLLCFGQISCVETEPSDQVTTKSADRSIEGREFGQPGYKIEKCFKSETFIDVSIANAV